jgi:3-hydroxyisobutyrate dehydrogenase-like beta-hydroxyacid dehydrogenase
VVGEEPGQAAVRKLLRSVFMKGLAAAAIEALSAAAAAGCEDWLREEIAGALTSADAALLERLETGSRRHAARRVHEVEDASALLRELGVEPRISEASAGWLTQLRDEGKNG